MSLIHLLCTQHHDLLPALAVGAVLTIEKSDQGCRIHSPGTPTMLTRIAQAFRDGALQFDDPTAPELEELAAEILAHRDRLLAEADQLIAQIRQQQTHRIAS